ncbi:hypothetical protein D3C74_464340 [compost metagenome]
MALGLAGSQRVDGERSKLGLLVIGDLDTSQRALAGVLHHDPIAHRVPDTELGVVDRIVGITPRTGGVLHVLLQ